ncbi:MAG: ribosome recycling factor, partial [Clostridia bacterium]|nr:ribosome recycling factor [Clostridia bacterium]
NKMGEECKIAMRNTRREYREQAKALEKKGDYTEDDLRDDETALQKALDKAIEQADKLIAEKEKEIMSV